MHDEVRNKMRAANIPVFAYQTTLVTEGAGTLREIIKQKEFKTEAGLASYVLQGNGKKADSLRTTRLAAVMAKELVLSGVRVHFVPLAGFVREVRLQDYAADRDGSQATIPVLQDIGTGYFVIPDFSDSYHDRDTWAEAQSLMVTHVNRGGGLILSTADAWEDAAAKCSRSFIAVAESFVFPAV